MRVIDVFNIPAFSSLNLKVMAGADGLNREFDWFHIIDIPQILPWADKGDIVFSCGYALQENQEIMEGLIESLYEKGIRAYFIVDYLYLKAIPPQMLEVADQLDFPVIMFPAETRLRDVTFQLCERLLGNAYISFQEYEQFQEKAMQIVLNDKMPLQTLVKFLKRKIEADVLLLDGFGRLLISGYIRGEYDDFLKHFRTNNIIKKTDYNETPITGYYKKAYFYYRIQYEQQIVFLVILKNIEDSSKTELITIKDIIGLISALINNSDALLNSKMNAQIPLLESILKGQYASESVAYLKAVEEGWYMDTRHIVVIFEIVNYNKYIVQNELKEKQIKEFRDGLISELVETIKKIQGIYPVIRQDLVFTTIFKLVSSSTEKRIIQSCNEIIYNIEKKYGITLLVGVSTDAKELTGLSARLAEAKDVMEILKNMKDTSLAKYDQVSFDILVNRIIRDTDLKEMYLKKMLDLEDYDHNYTSDLVHTLRVFINSQGNVAETARGLDVHRNTIKYRLHKIEEITGIPLSSANVFLNLSIILKIYDMRDKNRHLTG